MIRSSFVCALACAVAFSPSIVVAHDAADGHTHVHETGEEAGASADGTVDSATEMADNAIAEADDKLKAAEALGVEGGTEVKEGLGDAKAAVEAAGVLTK